MAGNESGSTEKLYHEIELIRSENLFCRKCVRFFSSKFEFSQHVREHIEENGGAERSYMSYVETYICSNCSKTFEVKSDLIIHYNTICIGAAYTCKHCRKKCGNLNFLQMHLMFQHDYSEERLLDEGFLTDLDDSAFAKNTSLLKSLESFSDDSIKSSTSGVTKHFNRVGGTKLLKSLCSNRKFRRSECKRRDLAFHLLDKMHTCDICNESFSRKCVLDLHVRKHILEVVEGKQVLRRTSAKSLAKKSRETYCDPATSKVQKISKATDSAEDTAKRSDSQRAIVQPSKVAPRPFVWKNFRQKRRSQCMESAVPTIDAMKESENALAPEVASSCPKSVLQPSVILGSSVWKKIKLNTKVPARKSSIERKSMEKSNKINKKPKFNKTKFLKKKKKSDKIKESNKKPKYESKQIIVCELCKRTFTDSYKLKRHNFIHTGERPYTCTKCNKSFARDDHLKRHEKKVCLKAGNAK